MSKSAFYRDFVIVLVLGIVGLYLISQYVLGTSIPKSLWISLGLISVATLIIHNVMMKAFDKRPQLFVAYFMGTLTGKLFLSAMILLVVGMMDRDNLKFTAIAYFAFYVLLTTVELKNLLPLLRSKND